MTGTRADERFDVQPVWARVRVTRDVGNVALDLGDPEWLDIAPLGGADTMHGAELAGTDTNNVSFMLTASCGTFAGDGARDRVLVDGANGTYAIYAARVARSCS